MASVRRLSAIMFTDMVGSTASAQANEAEAIKLRDEQAGIVRPLFATHQGREIKSMGDGFLAEFDSALRAVQCAIDIQQHLHERNSQPGVAAIQLRIGVHLGDVEQRETDIFGDAVNIASRVEPLANAGGVCISGQVFDQVRNKIPNRLEKLPPTALKGVEVPIDIYRVVLPWTVREIPSTANGPTRLAVLPFSNISPDPKDEYFADGLTEELITVLSQLRDLRVIARTSVTPYKSTSKGVSQIGAELGVSSILEGSVRKAGSRLRITIQLIDVGSQGHVWAKTYDRELDDIFAVQSELATQVAETLKIELGATETARLEARPVVRPDSYLAYLKGRTLLQETSKASLQAAKEQFELAMSLDPNNAAAHAGLAGALRSIGYWYPSSRQEELEQTCRQLATRAIELDPNLAEAHNSLAHVHWDDFDYAGAERELKIALSLNPSYSDAHWSYATILANEGRNEEMLTEMALAEGADPRAPSYLQGFALELIFLGRFDEALPRIQELGELESSGRRYCFALFQYYRALSDWTGCLTAVNHYESLDVDSRYKRCLRAQYYALTGDKDRARSLIRDEETLPPTPITTNIIPQIYADLGDLDDCFRWLEKAAVDYKLGVWRWRQDPKCEHVRKDPRFQVLLKKLRLA